MHWNCPGRVARGSGAPTPGITLPASAKAETKQADGDQNRSARFGQFPCHLYAERAYGESAYGVAGVVIVVALWATLIMPILGVPYPMYADGSANARVYENGRYLRSFSAHARKRFAVNIYIEDEHRMTAAYLAQGMAMRELADTIAMDLCGAE